MIGLRRGTVTLATHDDTWEEAAGECITLLKRILRDDAIDIQHVGSTAIHGICAKPVIDLVVGVSSFDAMLRHNEELSEQGIHFRGREHGEQLLYVCGDLPGEIRTHHIHVVRWNSDLWKNYLDFRDYLNGHEDAARAYSGLKEQLAARYPEDRSLYTAGKKELIDDILYRAAEWRRQNTEQVNS